MKIKMDYPLDTTSRVFDGTTHEIEPVGLLSSNIKNKKIFLMIYRDLTIKNNSMITILEKIGDKFQKVPLTDYNSEIFKKLVDKITESGTRESISILPNKISTRKKPISTIEFINMQEETNKEIYYDPIKNQYFWDSQHTKPIDDINELGVKDGNTIKGFNGEKYIIHHLKISSPISPITIFHNLVDNQYYWDSQCNYPISGGIGSLGKRAENTIYGKDGKIYIIVDVRVYKDRPMHEEHEIKANTQYQPSKNNHNANNGLIINKSIYYNVLDGKYYWNSECTHRILGAPGSLGQINGTIIEGLNGINYTIIRVSKETINTNNNSYLTKRKVYFDGKNFYWDPEQKLKILGAPNSIGVVDIEKNIITGKDGKVYNIVYTNEIKLGQPTNGTFRR